MYSKIIATDFDGTLCENKWPDIGEPNTELIRYLKRENEQGSKIILWTCREGDRLESAVKWCEEQGIKLAAINANVKEAIDFFGSDSRKIFANEYIDDKMCTRFKLPFVKEN